MKTVPIADGEGTIPLRTSINKVLGVFRHHCGEIASVHQPKGKRSHTRYLICDSCGTDQCGGKPYQAKIKANTYHSIEALQAAENAVLTVNTDNETLSDELTEETTTQQAESLSDDKPTDTAPHAVSTANQGSDNETSDLTENHSELSPLPTPNDIPVQASSDAVSTVNSIPTPVEPKQNAQTQAPKTMRIGIFAVIGGAIGALLAVAA
ncbi:hypothetical protein ACMAZF_01280 [Psychrobium sp. nBUS_13]|uniref:hypothetical protein n=1 Tax=Psychrobium sp. nBUS_13 TaxID=3395319 RepID=UPI003EBDB3A8